MLFNYLRFFFVHRLQRNLANWCATVSKTSSVWILTLRTVAFISSLLSPPHNLTSLVPLRVSSVWSISRLPGIPRGQWGKILRKFRGQRASSSPLFWWLNRVGDSALGRSLQENKEIEERLVRLTFASRPAPFYDHISLQMNSLSLPFVPRRLRKSSSSSGRE